MPAGCVGWCAADGKLVAFCSSPWQLLTLLQGARREEKGPKMKRRREQEQLQPNSKENRQEVLKMLLDSMSMSRGCVEAFECRGGWVVDVTCSYSCHPGSEELCI